MRLGTDPNAANDGPDPAAWSGSSWNRGALRSFFSSSHNEYTWPIQTPLQAPQQDNGNLWRQDHFVPKTVDGSGNVTNWDMAVDYHGQLGETLLLLARFGFALAGPVEPAPIENL